MKVGFPNGCIKLVSIIWKAPNSWDVTHRDVAGKACRGLVTIISWTAQPSHESQFFIMDSSTDGRTDGLTARRRPSGAPIIHSCNKAIVRQRKHESANEGSYSRTLVCTHDWSTAAAPPHSPGSVGHTPPLNFLQNSSNCENPLWEICERSSQVRPESSPSSSHPFPSCPSSSSSGRTVFSGPSSSSSD